MIYLLTVALKADQLTELEHELSDAADDSVLATVRREVEALSRELGDVMEDSPTARARQ